jgi:DNA replication licensing factor MCM7
MVLNVTRNAKRYVEILCKCVDACMPAPTVELTVDDEVLDVIREQRASRNAANQEETQSEQTLFPPTLTRR